MTTSVVPNRFMAHPGHLWAAGAAAVAFGLLAASPFGTFLAQAFLQGWLAVYVDAGAFRLFCI